jgi:hypothetical protein
MTTGLPGGSIVLEATARTQRLRATNCAGVVVSEIGRVCLFGGFATGRKG